MLKDLLRITMFICLTFASMTSANIQLSNAQGPQEKLQDKTIHFGCDVSSMSVHCSRIHNKFESFTIQGNSTTIYEAQANPEFVRGKDNLAVQMYANHRQSILFSNTSGISPKQFSIAFWIKGTKLLDETNSPDNGHIISQYNDNITAGWSFNAINLQNLRNESLNFNVYNDKGEAFSPPDIPIFHKNRFVHIVGTFDGSIVKVYKDGVFFGEAKFNGVYNNHIKYPLTLGGSSSKPLLAFGTASIDDLRYYERVISNDEIKQIYSREQRSVNTTSRDMIGHWDFNGNLNDTSGNNHHGRERTLISSMVFAPDGRLFFSEKDTGHIKVMKDEKVNSKPFATISNYYSNWEQGLLGLAIDPDFKNNHFIYLFYTSVNKETGNPFNRIIRFTDVDGQGRNKTVIFDDIPASKGYHSGGAMAFGPDNKLYVTIGDATQNTGCDDLPNSTGAVCPAQDPSSQLGKVLRINNDGSIPKDNPYPDSPVFNIGHLNMYGIAFDDDGFGLVSENGRSNYDEINTVEKGANYGSPSIQYPDSDPEISENSLKPLRTFYDAKCLTSLIFYNGDKVSQLKGKFLVGTFKSPSPIYALQVDNGSKQVVRELSIFLNKFLNNQVISLAQSPSGELYYASYEINKLDSVDTTKKIQTLFPIEINYSSPIVNITHLAFIPSKNEIRIDLESRLGNMNKININNQNYFSNLTVTVPKELLHQVENVTYGVSNMTKVQSKIADYSIQNITGVNDTVVNIMYKNDANYTLSISGNTSQNAN